MNTIRIYGGLGNQMFQYALYIAFRERGIRTRLSFLRFLYEPHHHGLELWKAFDLPLSMSQRVGCELMVKGEPFYRNGLCEWLFRVIIPRFEAAGRIFYRDKEEFSYDPLVFQQEGSLIEGIWQVENYFKACRSELLREFRFRLSPAPEIRALVEKLQSTSSVSLHIRRGDYYSNDYAGTHSVLDTLAYYRNAINYIRERVTSPEFFVFSDDIPWVKEHLPLADATYVDQNRGDRSFLDMYLMTLCRHNITANSTFSWWGAWLNTNAGKIVTIPDVWLRGRDCPGIYPEGWIKLPVE